MPCFTFPWGRFANHIYEFLGRWLMEGVPINRLAELLTTSSVSVVSLKTLYRWRLRIMGFLEKWWIDQRTRWVFEFQGGDGLLSLYREGINSNFFFLFILMELTLFPVKEDLFLGLISARTFLYFKAI